MLPKDGDRLVEDIFPGELFPSSHWNIIDQFLIRGLPNIELDGSLLQSERVRSLALEDLCPLPANSKPSIC